MGLLRIRALFVLLFVVAAGSAFVCRVHGQDANLQVQDAHTPALRTRPPGYAADSRGVTLEVIARDKAGSPIPGIQQPDLILLDNKKRIEPTALKVLSRPGEDHDSQLILVIDALNCSPADLARSEDAVEAFLRAHAGHLEHPTSILVVSDSVSPGNAGQSGAAKASDMALHARELFVHRIPPSKDATFLILSLKDYKTGLHRILEAQGGVGENERVRLSLQALSFIAEAQSSAPGAKLVLWISPGWPLLERSEAKTSEQIFDSVIYFSNLLRSARMVLSSISPVGVTPQDSSAETEGFLLASRPGAIRANGRAPGIPEELSDTYYEEFLKGARDAKESNPNDLALQVLAYQSGGLVLQHNNDLAAQVGRCAADLDSLYSLSYVPAPGSGLDVYHELEVRDSKVSSLLRTRAGFYLK